MSWIDVMKIMKKFVSNIFIAIGCLGYLAVSLPQDLLNSLVEHLIKQTQSSKKLEHSRTFLATLATVRYGTLWVDLPFFRLILLHILFLEFYSNRLVELLVDVLPHMYQRLSHYYLLLPTNVKDKKKKMMKMSKIIAFNV